MDRNQPVINPELIAIWIGLALTISACDEDNDKPKPTKTTAERILGIWEQPGYGNIYVVEDDQTTAYEFTRASCLKLDPETGYLGMTVADINNANITFSSNNSEFSFLETEQSMEVPFVRLTELPANCRTSLVKDTPVDIFQHFWNTFNDYYAFNTERGIDWSERYDTNISKISNDMSEDELFTVLSDTISPLDDGHTSIESDTDDFSSEKHKGFSKIIVDSFPLQTEYTDLDDYISSLEDQYLEGVSNYLDEDTIKTEKEITWGITNEGVGFLQINAMGGYAQTEDADVAEDLAAMKKLLDKVMTDLQDTPSMIIDVRLNGGGSDELSLAIANRFTDQRLQVMSKTSRTFKGETTPVYAYINPEGKTPYLKPVVIIAGSNTGSAAEIFLIAMSNLSPVTIIGEASNGALSDVLSKQLPNGWSFGLSNEVYLDLTGKSHEVRGIQPQTEVPVYSLDELKNGRNSAIEAALNTLGFGNNSNDRLVSGSVPIAIRF